MEEYLDQAEILLRDVVQSRDISTLVVLHHLRDLTKVLDDLKLYDECHLTGNCALDLAEALGRRSLEFRQEQAETLALIAGLAVYQPRARTLFIQAVSICEEVVANNASHSNKYMLFSVLYRAGHWALDSLGAQWLERAVQLMTKELPPTMVHPDFRCVIYNNYGNRLLWLKQHANATEAFHECISIHRTLINNNPAKYYYPLATELMNMAMALDDLGKYDDAIAAYKEVLGICSAMSDQDPRRCDELTARTFIVYGITLGNSKQVSEAAAMHKQAVSLCRNLAQTGYECTEILCDALYNYGIGCRLLGLHAESVLAFQESIYLRRALAATDYGERCLTLSLHHIVDPLLALGKHAEANAAADEALERNYGRVSEDCGYAPDFKSCFVCQRAMIPNSLPNISTPFPVLLVNSSRSGAAASPTPAETPNLIGETVDVSVHKRRQKFLGFFRRNRAQ